VSLVTGKISQCLYRFHGCLRRVGLGRISDKQAAYNGHASQSRQPAISDKPRVAKTDACHFKARGNSHGGTQCGDDQSGDGWEFHDVCSVLRLSRHG